MTVRVYLIVESKNSEIMDIYDKIMTILINFPTRAFAQNIEFSLIVSGNERKYSSHTSSKLSL